MVYVVDAVLERVLCRTRESSLVDQKSLMNILHVGVDFCLQMTKHPPCVTSLHLTVGASKHGYLGGAETRRFLLRRLFSSSGTPSSGPDLDFLHAATYPQVASYAVPSTVRS
jgi:hypothetical protein